jgi:hypothetical protein
MFHELYSTAKKMRTSWQAENLRKYSACYELRKEIKENVTRIFKESKEKATKYGKVQKAR